MLRVVLSASSSLSQPVFQTTAQVAFSKHSDQEPCCIAVPHRDQRRTHGCFGQQNQSKSTKTESAQLLIPFPVPCAPPCPPPTSHISFKVDTPQLVPHPDDTKASSKGTLQWQSKRQPQRANTRAPCKGNLKAQINGQLNGQTKALRAT